MLDIIRANGSIEWDKIRDMRSRASAIGEEITLATERILSDIMKNGMEAVRRYSMEFDRCMPSEIGKEQMEDAYQKCPPDLRNALQKAAENIRAYHEKMLAKTWEWELPNGCRLGQKVMGLDRVGVYVPGGTAAYPSTVLMNVVPAKVAGVSEISMVTPPTKNLNIAVLTAAQIAGVDRIFAVGGVQAIGALAYGAGDIPKVDKIVGPGNAFVAAAKRQVFGQVDIDMIAGPSEILIIADESADASYVAADMLSQAEHDRLASAVLLTTSEKLAHDVRRELEKQISERTRKEIINKSFDDFGAIMLFDQLDDACAIANEIAPEHLEIMTRNPRRQMEKISHAGAIFLGKYSPEPLGDYMAGPCHVLPTSGTARFFSPLSTDSFLKKSSVIEYTKDALSELSAEIQTLANAEGLDAHANSIKVRDSI